MYLAQCKEVPWDQCCSTPQRVLWKSECSLSLQMTPPGRHHLVCAGLSLRGTETGWSNGPREPLWDLVRTKSKSCTCKERKNKPAMIQPEDCWAGAALQKTPWRCCWAALGQQRRPPASWNASAGIRQIGQGKGLIPF